MQGKNQRIRDNTRRREKKRKKTRRRITHAQKKAAKKFSRFVGKRLATFRKVLAKMITDDRKQLHNKKRIAEMHDDHADPMRVLDDDMTND